MTCAPVRMYVSTGFTPAAWARIVTCPDCGNGSGTFSSFITSGGPNSRTRIARMEPSYSNAFGAILRIHRCDLGFARWCDPDTVRAWCTDTEHRHNQDRTDWRSGDRTDNLREIAPISVVW